VILRHADTWPYRNTSINGLLITGVYEPGSGLTKVVSTLARELNDRFSIHCLGFQRQMTRSSSQVVVAGCPMQVQASSCPVFLADADWLRQHMDDVAPQVVLVAGPAYLATPLLRQLQKYRPNLQLFLYLPVEGEMVNNEIAQTLDLVDVCILYTQDARSSVVALCAQAAERNPALRTPHLYVVGHGVDTSDFFPLRGSPDGHFTSDGRAAANEGRAAAKRRLFPEQPELHTAFLVLNANRAYQRKRLDLTIAGFAEFARSHADAYLYLHTGPTSSQQSEQLRALIAESGVAGQVLLNTLNPSGASLPIEHLNLLYNACDVGLTTAMGEGWGLVSFEHAATGAPQIVPDHTSFTENWTGAAEMLPPVGREHIFYELADMFVVSPHDVALALERLHDNCSYRQRMAKAAYARATEPRYLWSKIGRRFGDLLDHSLAAMPTKKMQAAR
jgi:D-inositol-3-phosphate glycosyltransferase